MLTGPTIKTTAQYENPQGTLPVTNLLRTHPVGYSQLPTGENYSTGQSGVTNANIEIEFFDEFIIEAIVIDGS